MTITDFANTRWTDETPSLATHQDVTTTFDLNPDVLSRECVSCCLDPSVDAPGTPTMRVLYDCWDVTDQVSDMCGRHHCDEELTDLLQGRPEDGSPRNIRLLLPAKWAPAVVLTHPPVHPEDDEIFQIYDSLRRFFDTTLRNDVAADMTGPEGFERAKDKVLEVLSGLCINRAEQLRRGAA